MKPSGTCAALLLMGSLLVACGGDAQSDGPRVVASFYPFAFVAEQVGGRAVDVDNLTAPGTEPHDIELRPQQVGAMQDADLVVYQRGFQAAVDDAVDRAHRADADIVDVADLVPSTRDPHTWLDPRTMNAITQAVEAKLAEADPDHASAYAANAQRLEPAAGRPRPRPHGRAEDLSHPNDRHEPRRVRPPRRALRPPTGADRRYRPHERADAVRAGGGSATLVRREHITTVFTEELVSPAIAETVARETGARTATLDPIEGLGDDSRDETYLTLMRHDLDAIQKANGCS